MLDRVTLASNEPAPYKELTFGDTPTAVEPLTVGDAWLISGEATIIVERKTVEDLLASIQDGRLLAQAGEMGKLAQMFPRTWCYLIITGKTKIHSGVYWVAGKATKFGVRRVEGALATVQQLGVTVIRNITPTPAAYADTLRWLARRDRGAVRVGRKREAFMSSRQERVLMELSANIGEARAEGLMANNPNLAWALVALADGKATSIPGVGKATCDSVRTTLGLEFDQEFGIVIKEEVDE